MGTACSYFKSWNRNNYQSRFHILGISFSELILPNFNEKYFSFPFNKLELKEKTRVLK
jgi:hypothetical protein